MICGGPIHLFQSEGGLLFLLFRSLFDLMEGECEFPMSDSHGPVDTVLHDNLVYPYPVLYLVELFVVLYDVIVSYRPLCLDAEDGIKVYSIHRTVEVPPFLWGDGKLSVVPGKIGDEEHICFLDGADAGQSHFFDQSILECFEEPLNPSFRLGGMGMDQLDAKLF